MKKDEFEKYSQEKISRNFDTYLNFFGLEFEIFHHLKPQIFEITNCLILELHQTSITSINNLVERVLKLSLIYKESGLDSVNPEDLGDKFSDANEKYSSIEMSKSLG
jgi:hypothetical protein